MSTRSFASIFFLLLISNSATATLLGTSINAQLESATFAVGDQFTASSIEIGLGVEFVGAMQFGSGSSDLAGLALDFDADTLTVTPRQLSGLEGICCAPALIVVRLTNFDPSISGITESFASGLPSQVLFTPEIAEIQLVFRYWNVRLLHQYQFSFATVASPGTTPLMLIGLASLCSICRKVIQRASRLIVGRMR